MDFETGITQLIEKAKADYLAWCGPRANEPHVAIMIEQYNDGFRIDEGSKFVKIVSRDSVHCFVSKGNFGKFRRGDILKAASWRQPAKNFARGNVIDGTFDCIRWTGAL